jgi:hypothetical protein
MAKSSKRQQSVSPLPPLQWNGHFWVGRIQLRSWQGFQSRLGPYGSESSPTASDGTAELNVATPGSSAEQPPSAEQANSFRYLLENEAAIRDTLVAAIWEEYWSVREKRLARGEVLPSDMPALASSEQLKSQIGLSIVHILPVAKDNAAYVGFEFGCTWEEEHGLGVMTHQGRIVELTDKGIAKVNQADLASEEWVAEEDAQAPEPVAEEDLTIGEQLRRAGPRCSFCGQTPDKVGPFVEGMGLKNRGGVFICRSCVERIAGVLEEEARRTATKVRECLRCHAVISKDAATCPECGFPRL